MQPSDHYAVMGNPVAHSQSPAIHSLFASQTGQRLHYESLLVAEGAFDRAVAAFFAGKGRGLNVTVPFKEQACALAGQLSARARRCGTVNTLWQDSQGLVHGDTTDGAGLLQDLRHNMQVPLEGRRILVLGAGGAVRSIVEPLLAQKPHSLVIANRTPARVQALLDAFPDDKALRSCGLDELDAPFDLVINGTSAGLQGGCPAFPDAVIASYTRAYDMLYSAGQTDFNRRVLSLGVCQAFDGLGMLVEQAAESFFLWRGVRPQTAPVIASIRERLQG